MIRPALVLDGDTTAALAIVRSLGRRGVPVIVGAPTERPLASRSKYCRESWTYPDPATDRGAFLRAVATRDELLIPVTDWTGVPLAEAEQAALLPPRAALEITLSKADTMALAAEAGVPVPPGRRVTEGPVDVTDLSPGVAKPDRSKAWRSDLGRHRSVVPYADADAGRRAVERLLPTGPVLVQGQVPGEAVGVAAFATRGRLRFAFQYRRLHEVPMAGGGSSWRISEPLAPEFAADAQRLVAALGWDGALMLEYKRSGSRRWLIEINGRFWGSLPLAVAAGADFPWVWYAHATGQPWQPPQITPGVAVRHLVRDVEWFKEAARALPPRRLLAEVAALPRGRFDALQWRDPGPSLATLARAAHEIATVPRGRLARRRLRAEMGRLRANPPQLTGRVVFVCEGNIIRSAYGEALARHRAPAGRWASAGLVAWPDRPAHPAAQTRAAARGLSLTAHRAQAAEHALADADWVIAMTFDQVRRLREGWPQLADRVVLLGCFGGDQLEIPDPDGGPEDGYGPVLDAVEAGVAGLLANR